MKPDIIIEVTFDVNNEKVEVKTNAKFEKIEELLGEYLHSIVGAGKDASPMAEKDVYKITIGLELADDSWGTSHDCGNKGLRDGIIMRVLKLVGENSPKVTFAEL